MSDTDTIAELFARDPFTHTSQETDQIIQYFRERRRDFKLSGKGAPRIEKPRASLEDLGL